MANQPLHNRSNRNANARTARAAHTRGSAKAAAAGKTRSSRAPRKGNAYAAQRAAASRGHAAPRGKAASRNRAASHAAQNRNTANLRAQAAGSASETNSRPSMAEANEGGLLSRRNFLYGAVGVGAVAVAAGGGAAVYFASQNGNSDLEYLEVPEDAVSTLDDFELIEDSSTCLSLYGNAELPLGSLVWCNSDEVAACLIPTETGSPLAQVALLMLGSATYNVVLSKAVGASSGFEIYDVRATSKGAIWTEANILEGVWRIYTATISGGDLGTPVLADEGDSSYETPSIGAVDGYGFWQKQAPATADTSSSDTPNTQLMRVKLGQSGASSLFESTRRMATPLYAGDDAVVITPRSKLARSYVCITKINAESGEVVDAVTLPRSMTPFEVGCGDTGLIFSFENIYNYGDGIANLGTYAPLSKVGTVDFSYSDTAEAASGSNSASALPYDNTQSYSASKWFRFGRTPTAAPAFCGNYLIVKSSYSVCGVNLKSGEYFAIDVDNGADDYGEYLATTGSHDTLVTYTSIDYTPVNDEAQQMCRVKIWKPLSA